MKQPFPLEYAKHGLVGLLVPPANTTVEAEAALLLPPGIGWITARLVGRGGDGGAAHAPVP
jgi:hypothetical protein